MCEALVDDQLAESIITRQSLICFRTDLFDIVDFIIDLHLNASALKFASWPPPLVTQLSVSSWILMNLLNTNWALFQITVSSTIQYAMFQATSYQGRRFTRNYLSNRLCFVGNIRTLRGKEP